MNLRAKIARGLHHSGYAVEIAADACRALRLASRQKIDAAIVASDSSLAGLAMARKLRDTVSKMLVLAERREDLARLSRSLPEVDAFLLKSSSEEELIGRLTELLLSPKAAADSALAPTILWIEDRKLDLAARLLIDAEGRGLPLTRAECALLTELASSRGQIRSRDELRHAVAGRGIDSGERSIDMLVARLRQKIEPDPKNPRFLVTLAGAGYKLVAPRQNGNGQHSEAKSDPERRHLTALSCGLVDSFALTRKYDPEDLANAVRGFHDSCTAVVTRMGGKIFTRSTDKMLALFGYSEAHEDDSERAVHAGLDLVEKIGQLQSPAIQPLQVQIGVATGLALVGPEQVLGEPLGLAKELRKLSSPNSVLIAESTRKFLSRVFTCEDLARHQLSGSSHAVNACRVTGRRTVESRFKAMRPQGVTRLVGRDRELRQLLALWDRAKRGEGQVALVCGEPGIGKSHLWVALLEHIAEDPHVTIRYECSPYHPNSPFYPIISQLDQTIGFEQTDTPANKFRKMEVALFQGLEVARNDFALFADLLSIRTTERVSALTSTSRQHKDLIIAALTRHLLHIAGQQPLIIVLEDVHWIDSSTLELVERIIWSIGAAQVLVLMQFRPEFCPAWLGQHHLNMLRLDRLGREDTCAIISGVTGGKQLPAELQEQIILKTDGIPLFVEELTRSILESGLLEDVGDRYVAAEPLSTLVIPATLLGSLCARLDRLGPAKKVAQIGSAIGREFSYSLLAAVASESTNSLQAALKQIAASGLISACGEPPEATYSFKHALIQDAAYTMLSRSARRQLHRRIVDALENNFPYTIETQPDLLAHHLAEAGFIARAIDFLRKAARRAIEASANPEAIGQVTRALQLLHMLPSAAEREHLALELNLMLAQTMIVGRGYAAPETKQALLRTKMLINGSASPSQKFSVLYGLWAGHYVGAEVAKQRIAAAEFLDDAEGQNDTAALCIAHRMLGTNCVTSGQFEAGLRSLERAHALFDAEHHSRFRFQYGQDIGAAALCYLSWALWHLGFVDQASNIADQAMRRAEELCHPHTLVYTICHARGFMEIFRRRSEHLQSHARLVISICAEHGLSHWMNFGRILEGWDAICRGDVKEGIEVLQRGIAGWQKAGAGLWVPIFRTMEAEGYAKAGRGDNALQTIDRALAAAMETGERWAIAEMFRVKARLLSGAKADQIEAWLVKSVTVARRQRARCWELRASCELARLWEGQGRSKQAAQLLRSIYDQFVEGFGTMDLQEAKSLMAGLETSTCCSQKSYLRGDAMRQRSNTERVRARKPLSLHNPPSPDW
jgi:predicted ATPase/DNA-binding response OmpR family regulator